MKKLFVKYKDEAVVYGFTVLCTFFGDYILNKTRPDFGWLPIAGALISSVILCLVVDLMQGKTDTPEKRAGKKKNFKLNLVISGIAGLASGSVMPVIIKTTIASVGIQL